jgi:hypothetical protein
VGLLINFNVVVLKDGVRRLVHDKDFSPQRHREHGEESPSARPTS